MKKSHAASTKKQLRAMNPERIDFNVSRLLFVWPAQMMELMMSGWQSMLPGESSLSSSHANSNLPPLPESETTSSETAYLYTIKLPGIHAKDIALTVAGNMIELTARHEEKREGNGADSYSTRHIRECFSIPAYTDGQAIKAALHKGVLTITIPKTDKPKRATSGPIKIAAQ